MKAVNHPLYYLFNEMKRRSCWPKAKDYKSYKHVTISPRWKKSFWNFVEDMPPRPTKKHSIDRIDNLKGYSKENCRWATITEQTLNRRINYECHKGHKWTKETIIWTHNGKKKARRCKICYEARKKR